MTSLDAHQWLSNYDRNDPTRLDVAHRYVWNIFFKFRFPTFFGVCLKHPPKGMPDLRHLHYEFPLAKQL